MKHYALYHDESKFDLIIKPWSEGIAFEGMRYWNENYYLSCDRKLLRNKAMEIKEEWLNKRLNEIDKLEKLKIKNKY